MSRYFPILLFWFICLSCKTSDIQSDTAGGIFRDKIPQNLLKTKLYELPHYDYPFSAMGRLYVLKNGKGGACSASLIGRKHLITAAHCLFNKEPSDFSEEAIFMPFQDKNIISDAKMEKVVALGWTSSEGPIKDDWAILKLTYPVADVTDFLDIKVVASDQLRSDPIYTVVGLTSHYYEGKVPALLNNCALRISRLSKGAFEHLCPQRPGMSGGPVFIQGGAAGGRSQLVGIVQGFYEFNPHSTVVGANQFADRMPKLQEDEKNLEISDLLYVFRTESLFHSGQSQFRAKITGEAYSNFISASLKRSSSSTNPSLVVYMAPGEYWRVNDSTIIVNLIAESSYRSFVSAGGHVYPAYSKRFKIEYDYRQRSYNISEFSSIPQNAVKGSVPIPLEAVGL